MKSRAPEPEVEASPEPELMYVVCDRLLDEETDERCDYDGEQRLNTRGNWTCPQCGGLCHR
jgi:hypothetical protein